MDLRNQDPIVLDTVQKEKDRHCSKGHIITILGFSWGVSGKYEVVLRSDYTYLGDKDENKLTFICDLAQDQQNFPRSDRIVC